MKKLLLIASIILSLYGTTEAKVVEYTQFGQPEFIQSIEQLKATSVKAIETLTEQEVTIQNDAYVSVGAFKNELDSILLASYYGFETSNDIGNIKISVDFNEDEIYVKFSPIKNKVKENKAFIKKSVKEIAAQCPTALTDEEKVRWVYDYVINNVSYLPFFMDENATMKNNIVNAIVDGKTQCFGYAQLTAALLSELGFENKIIAGKVYNKAAVSSFNAKTDAICYEVHAWNLVYLNNKWYQLDTTFGDKPEKNMQNEYFLKENFQDQRFWIASDFELTAKPVVLGNNIVQ